jgi:hypothetical protein
MAQPPAAIPRTPDGRIPSLDGLRAISIIMVILSHIAGTRDLIGIGHLFNYFGNWGNLGVQVFFVISGFLITTLLLNELERHGTVSLKNFIPPPVADLPGQLRLHHPLIPGRAVRCSDRAGGDRRWPRLCHELHVEYN